MSERKPSVEASLPLNVLRLDGGTQVREFMRQDKVDEYAERMQAGDHFPRADVFYDGTDYWVADGFHRIGAAAKLGRKTIDVIVHDGNLRDAILFAIRSNARHGIELTSGDKKQKILRLLRDQEWSKYPTKTLAEIARVSHSYFMKVKQEIKEENLITDQDVLWCQKHPPKRTSAIKEIRGIVKEELTSEIELADNPPTKCYNFSKDQLDHDLPPITKEAFTALPVFSNIRGELKWSISQIKYLATLPGGKLLETDQLCAYLVRAVEKLYEAEPYVVCQVCNADNPLCGRCDGTGWVSRMSYEAQRKTKK